jgi:hypothetical protein
MGIKDLPLDAGKRIYKVFEKIGFELKGRSEKNHFILRRPNDPYLFISIPDHPEVDRRTLKAEVRKTGLTDKQFRLRYDEMYAPQQPVRSCELVEMEATCVLCHEPFQSGQEKVLQQSGLYAHRECHEHQFGTA